MDTRKDAEKEKEALDDIHCLESELKRLKDTPFACVSGSSPLLVLTIQLPANKNNTELQLRIDNIKYEHNLRSLRHRFSSYSSLLSGSFRTEAKDSITALQTYIQNLTKLLLSEDMLREITIKKIKLNTYINSLKRPVSGIKVTALHEMERKIEDRAKKEEEKDEKSLSTFEKHLRHVKKQFRLFDERVDLDDEIIDMIEYRKKQFIQESIDIELNQFKIILVNIYLKLHDKESLKKLKEELTRFINQRKQLFNPPEYKVISKRNTTQYEFTSIQIERRIKASHSEQKQAPMQDQIQYTHALNLAKALLDQLEKIKDLSDTPRKLGIDVTPALYFAVNWNDETLFPQLLDQIKLNKNIYGLVKLIMKKHKAQPENKFDGFLKLIKCKFKKESMTDEKFLEFLQLQSKPVKRRTQTLFAAGSSNAHSLQASIDPQTNKLEMKA